jgi:hypothetical protein
MNWKRAFCLLAAALWALPAAAQVRTSVSGNITPSKPGASPTAPAAPGNVSPLVAQVQSAARTTTADVSLLNIRKWKVSNDVKNDADAKAQAIQRNLTVAMPEILAQVQNSPNDLTANFKLYRTLGVLYDVLSSLAESAGAFGPKSEFEPLASDLNRIDVARRNLGERLETLAIAKDAEMARLQDQVKAARTAAATTPPKKIIVDDDSQKKSAKKTAKKKPPATTSNQDASRPANPQ